jgi:glutamyl-tRNA reductase
MNIEMLRIVGCSHQNTGIDQREQLILNKELRASFISDCLRGSLEREVIVLATCNRVEIVSYGVEFDDIINIWSRLTQVGIKVLEECCYHKQGLNALTHWVSVSVGIDSAMLGEPDILGQMKKAHMESKDVAGQGAILHRLGQWVMSTAKQVRVGSGVGNHATSFVSMSQMLAKRLFTNWRKASILLIGSGGVIESALGLWAVDNSNIMICNRSLAKANILASRYGARAVGMSQIPELLKSVDCVITATSSPLPLIGKGMLERAVKHQSRPMLLIDLAMPRDIEPEVGGLEEVYLYHLDDLKLLAKGGESRQKQGCDVARNLIGTAVRKFQSQVNLWDSVDSISEFRTQLHALGRKDQNEILEKWGSEHRLQVEKSLEDYHRKIMHHATVLMKGLICNDSVVVSKGTAAKNEYLEKA